MPVLGLSFSKTGLVIATAGWSAQAAWWWLIPIIAIIAGVIIALSSLSSQEEELAKKTEKLNAAYETFSENANQAKENLEQLAEA
jgi:4-hydroxybenzoate polyprenyltransferase